MEYKIKNKKLEITINSLGAEITSVKYEGKERSWQNENGKWNGHAPILFPICGSVKAFFNGIQYPLPCHGFIYTNELSLKWKKNNAISFCFNSNNNTYELYPYYFRFEVVYSLRKNRIKIEYFITNNSKQNMFFGAGSHDSFVVDGNLEDYYIKFNKNESFEILDEKDGYLLGTKTKMPYGKILRIRGSNLKDDCSIVLGRIKSRTLSLINKENKKSISICFKNFNNLVLWRSENANMICLEPWLNLPDLVEEKQREFSTINGLRVIKQNKTDHIVRTIKYF